MSNTSKKQNNIFDYSLLRGRIKTVCQTEEKFAEKMGISQNTLTRKFKQDGFNQLEIDMACAILLINPSEISTYFFTKKVGKLSTI